MNDQPGVITPDSSPSEPISTPPLPPADSTLSPTPVVSQSPLPPPDTNTPPPPYSPQPNATQLNPSTQVQPQVPQSLENPAFAPQQPGQGFVDQNNSTGGPVRHSKLKFMLPLALVLIVAIGLGTVFAFRGLHSSSKLDCTPPSGNTVNEATAITVYKTFVQAVKTSNQSCANSLSSTFFLSYAKQAFAAPDGKWITSNPSGVGAISNDFSKLPSNLISSKFVKKDYSRPQVQNANGGNASYYSPAQGITLRYPAGFSRSSSNGQSEFYFFVAFVSQKGKIVVDNFVEGPADSFF